MKNILLISAILFSTMLTAQDININADVKSQDNSKGWLDEEGVHIKDGKLFAIETSLNGFKGKKTQGKKLDKIVQDYVEKTGLKIEFQSESWRPPGPGVPSKLTKVFKVLNAKMTKSQALAKFKELKEYLEMGLINKEEFDRESEKIKKLLIGN